VRLKTSVILYIHTHI